MLAFLVLFQDWIPYLVAITYIGIHHGIVGVPWPQEVYNHRGTPVALDFGRDPARWRVCGITDRVRRLDVRLGVIARATVARSAAQSVAPQSLPSDN